MRITRINNFESKKYNPVIKVSLLKLGKVIAVKIIGLLGIRAKKHFILLVKR